MPTDLMAGLIAFAFVMSITPGPNNILLLASGVTFGFRRTVPHMLGISVGVMIMLLLVGLGIAQVFALEPRLYVVLKWVSVAYMLWLAWKIATSGPIDGESAGGNSRPMTFLQGAAFQWVNPKAWVMALTAVSAYTVPAQYTLTLFLMAAVFGAVNLPSVSVWTLFGVVLKRVLTDPFKVRVFNVVMALGLVASLYPVLVVQGH